MGPSTAVQPRQSVEAEPVLEIKGISKSFPGVQALERVDLKLYPGQVTALVGENGAGKSTLVKILTGVYRPDEGRIVLAGEDVSFPNAESATRAGVTAIHQETVLFDDLSVTDNIFLGHQHRNRFGLLDWPSMVARARSILAELEADIDPQMRLRDLSIARKHLVAVARALSIDAKIVIMDEPTAALSHREVEDLYAIIEKLRRDGKAILFISHKFEEIFRIADHYAVFRDGRSVGAGDVSAVTQDELITLMVGRTVEQIFPKAEVALGDTVLEVDGLCHTTEFADISFSLRRGEILGFYGLIGSGRSELMQAIFGVSRLSAGTIRLDGEPIEIRSPRDAIDAGIVYVPEERQRDGAILSLPIFANISLPSLRRGSRYGLLDTAWEFDVAREYAQRLNLRAAYLSQHVEALSGGNQQKVVLSKWLATQPKVIILDEPTKGIDVGSKAAVHEFMSKLVATELAVVMISSEIPEILGMSDRVAVMRDGRTVAVFDRAELDADKLVRAATGNIAGAKAW